MGSVLTVICIRYQGGSRLIFSKIIKCRYHHYDLDIRINKKRLHTSLSYNELTQKIIEEKIQEITSYDVVVYIPEIPKKGDDLFLYIDILGYFPYHCRTDRLKDLHSQIKTCPCCGFRLVEEGAPA